MSAEWAWTAVSPSASSPSSSQPHNSTPRVPSQCLLPQFPFPPLHQPGLAPLQGRIWHLNPCFRLCFLKNLVLPPNKCASGSANTQCHRRCLPRLTISDATWNQTRSCLFGGRPPEGFAIATLIFLVIFIFNSLGKSLFNYIRNGVNCY